MNTGPYFIDKYQLQERLGRGGMAEVWKAWDTHLQRHVAIKFLHADLQADPTFIKRFEREARAVAALHHPNIIRIHDFQISEYEDGSPFAYMVTQYIEGHTLASLLQATARRGQYLTAGEIKYIISTICRAVDYAHQHGMIHRDLKPSNILMDIHHPSRYHMGEPILTDFGIVKLLGGENATLSGTWLGTPHYISPEQAQGQPGNEQSDIYSLGVILYEICTGVRPFRAENPLGILMQHIHTDPQPPVSINPRISPDLSSVILTALAKDPAQRFPNAQAMATALTKALDTSSPADENQTIISHISPTSNPEGTTAAPQTPRLDAVSLFSTNPVPGTPPLPSRPVDPTTAPISPPEQLKTRELPPTPLSEPFVPEITRPLPKRRHLIVVAVSSLIVFLLIASSVAAFLLLRTPAPQPVTSRVIGRAMFISSNPLDMHTQSDQVRIDLSEIPSPAPGKSYHVWLLGDSKPSITPICGSASPQTTTPLALGKLTSRQKTLLYIGNGQHTNLLGLTSRLLISEEPGENAPQLPTMNGAGFYAEIPQFPDQESANNLSPLDVLRCLLVESSDLRVRNIKGGLAPNLLSNMRSVVGWAQATKLAWENKNATEVRANVIRILDYLDGTELVQGDLPASTPFLADKTLAQVPIRTLNLSQDPQGYVDRMISRVSAIRAMANTSAEMKDRATRIVQTLDDIQGTRLLKLYQDSKQLFGYTPEQLISSSSLPLINDLLAQADITYNGAKDQKSGTYQGGVVWVYEQIQQLASFEIKSCTPQLCA